MSIALWELLGLLMGVKKLQARFYWRSLKWLKCIKWPSADAFDFGAFVVEFDFKKQAVWKVEKADGSRRQIASFPKQKRVPILNNMQGPLVCGDYEVEIGSPFVLHAGVVQLTIRNQGDTFKDDVINGDLFNELRYKDLFFIRPKKEDRDVYLELEYEEVVEDVALLVTSLLVFARFSDGGTDVG